MQKISIYSLSRITDEVTSTYTSSIMIWKTLKPTHPLLRELAPCQFITQTRQWSLGGRPSEYKNFYKHDPGGCVSRESHSLSGEGRGGYRTLYRTRTGNLPPVCCFSSSHSNKICEWEGQISRRWLAESFTFPLLLVVRDGWCSMTQLALLPVWLMHY